MAELFEPELKYTRIPVDKVARKQAELEAKRSQAKRLQDAGARVVLNEDTLALHYEFNANPDTALNVSPKVEKADASPTKTVSKIQTITRQQTQKYEATTPAERLLKQSEELTLRGITHTVDLDELTLRVGYKLYQFGAKQ